MHYARGIGEAAGGRPRGGLADSAGFAWAAASGGGEVRSREPNRWAGVRWESNAGKIDVGVEDGRGEGFALEWTATRPLDRGF